jgi:hypothetical protein
LLISRLPLITSDAIPLEPKTLGLRWSHIYATDKGGEMKIIHPIAVPAPAQRQIRQNAHPSHEKERVPFVCEPFCELCRNCGYHRLHHPANVKNNLAQDANDKYKMENGKWN